MGLTFVQKPISPPIFEWEQFFTNPFYWLVENSIFVVLFHGRELHCSDLEPKARLMYGLSSSQEVVQCLTFSPKASGIPSVWSVRNPCRLKSKVDEYGKAVHEECYVSKLTGTPNGQGIAA